MPAFLSWIDHDAEERERMNRILALFRERETRDELGLGSVRDAIADRLFPGTSTIQTRLRYMLFIPWICVRIEQDGVPSADAAKRGRKAETNLIEALVAAGEETGVLGARVRAALKRLPSSVYWAGLENWGIRRFSGSQDQYHRSLDGIRRRRERSGRADDGDAGAGSCVTWDPKLPSAPAGFPEVASFALDREEAEYLRDRIVASAPQSLLAFLAANPTDVTCDFPWEHPLLGSFRPEHRELLHHARLFSDVMYGASLLYNVLLCEQHGRAERLAEHREWLREWSEHVDLRAGSDWNLMRFWALVTAEGGRVGKPTRDFVETWVRLALACGAKVEAQPEARALVRAREVRLKGKRSRFTNQLAADQWGGASGMGRIAYRWGTAQTFLDDLTAGLGRA